MLCYKLIGFAILSLAFVQAQDSGCRNNFSPVGDKCLKLMNTYNTWYVADRECRSLGAGILSFQNATQLQEIEMWMGTKGPWVYEFWTSGNSLGEKGTFYWQSTGELARYLPWTANQPQTSNGDCLTLKGTQTTSTGYSAYRLAVDNCMTYNYYICEQKQEKYSTRICLKPGSYENAQVLS